MKPVSLITGAASGLGWALAQALAASGHRLILVDLSADLLAERAAELPAGCCLLSQALDITEREPLAALVRRIERDIGRLDYLVNNAGITHRSLAEQTRPEVIAKVMAVDYQAPVEWTLALLPLLKKSRGQIVNISSMAGWMPVLGRAGYCAAKAALHQYFEVLRAELQDQGVAVLMVYPSFLDTPIEQNALGADGNKTPRARSTIGQLQSAGWMAAQIVTAMEKRAERLFPDKATWAASLLYKLFPRFFIARMRRKFAVELSRPAAGA